MKKDVMDTVEGSIPFYNLADYSRNVLRHHQIDLKDKFPKDATAKVGRSVFSAKWLQHYAMMRHFQNCMVMASDYANKMTGMYKTIVRDHNKDIKLLAAWAKIASKIGHKKHCSVRHRGW